MGWIKKVWKDRMAEYPTRRRLTKTDGTNEIVTVSREEGQISQEGDAFSAANMNDLETRINEGFTDVNSNLKTKQSKDWTVDCYGWKKADGFKWLDMTDITETYVVILDSNNLYHPFFMPCNQYTEENREFGDGVVKFVAGIGRIALLTDNASMSVLSR